MGRGGNEFKIWLMVFFRDIGTVEKRVWPSRAVHVPMTFFVGGGKRKEDGALGMGEGEQKNSIFFSLDFHHHHTPPPHPIPLLPPQSLSCFSW